MTPSTRKRGRGEDIHGQSSNEPAGTWTTVRAAYRSARHCRASASNCDATLIDDSLEKHEKIVGSSGHVSGVPHGELAVEPICSDVKLSQVPSGAAV